MEKMPWHLDRKVPVSLALALFLNVGATVWWAATLSAMLNNQQKTITMHDTQIAAIAAAQAGVGERLATLEAGQAYQTKILDKIDDKLGAK